MNLNDEICEKIKKVVLESGKIILDANRMDLNVKEKDGNNNIVTKYDVLVQNKLKKELLEIMPEAGFLGEEDFEKDIENEYVFVVDPIDGTTNFARDLKVCAISVALLQNQKPVFGVCYNPYTNELYEAKKGSGAFLNGKEIHVSNRTLQNGIVLSGCSPYYGDLRRKSLELNNKFASIASDYRRFGSAVLEICNVAAGKAELYFELKLMPWDYSASSLILEEAGGEIKTLDGKEIKYFEPTSIFASNGVEDYFKYIK